MKPLTLEETGLKEELKRQYYEKEKLGIKNSRENFKLLCHLEDFEIQYWELQKENEQLKIQISAREEVCNRLESNWNKLNKKYENAVADYEKTMFEKEQLKKQLEELKSTNKVLSEELTKDKILKQDCLTTCCGIPIGDIPKLITQQKEFINFLEDNYKKTQDIWYIKILQKYRSIIGCDKVE